MNADLLVVNARPWSGERLRDADAVAVAAGRIVAVGRAARFGGLRGPATRVLDARDATVTPGFTDSHIHFLTWARSLAELSLEGCATRAAAVERVAAHLVRNPGDEPLIGRGWDANFWDRPPHREALDPVTGGRPVMLHSHDFHSAWLNSAALAAVAIDATTPDPAGGVIERDAAGRPTGVLREHAVRRCADLERRAPPSPATLREAAGRLHALGITGIHDFEGAEAMRLLSAQARGPHPRLRVLMHLPHAALEYALAFRLGSGTGDDRFRIGALKLFADGTLGSRTAAMLEPYEDGGGIGLDLMPAAELRETIRRAVEGGMSVAVHAIGDRAARTALDAFEAVRDRIPDLALPPRLEHVQLLDPLDLPRLARLGVAASMQPLHCTSDRDVARRAWGRRCDLAYPWRSLAETGALLAFGSDAPVEPPSIAHGLHAAVTREGPDRDGPFVPGQRIGLDRALSAYTEGPSRLAGAWPRTGVLRVGACADLVIWNDDLHRLPPAALRDAHPVATVMDGEVVHTSHAGRGHPAPERAPEPARTGEQGGR